jgi:phage terminase large subunit-like protein
VGCDAGRSAALNAVDWALGVPELAGMGQHELAALARRAQWRKRLARPNQLPPANKDWDIWLLLAGRGFGKTRSAVEWLWWEAWNDPGSYNHVVVRRSEDLQKVAFEGPSGLFRLVPPEIVAHVARNPYRMLLKNGASILGFTADEPDVLRGPESARTWCDETAAWRRLDQTWNDGVLFGTRISTDRNGGRPKIVVTTTPRPIKLLDELVKEARGPNPGVILTYGSTNENIANLSAAAVERLQKKFAGTRRGKQELEGQLLMDIPGALFSLDIIAKNRVWAEPTRDYKRVVVAVDPPASSEERSNECGLVACGLHEKRGYVLRDLSDVMSPEQWGSTAVRLHDELDADAIVVEVNQGGEMCRTVIETAAQDLWRARERRRRDVTVNMVRATKGKWLRAEPISQLYSQGFVSHVGEFEELEQQMCVFTPDYDRKKEGSPDRLDALVWGLTDLLVEAEVDLAGTHPYETPRSRGWKIESVV